MTAPAPSPAEQAVIDRFDAAEPLPESMEGWAERVLLACGLPEGQLHAGGPITPVAYLAAAAVAAYRAAQDGGAEEALRERMAHVWADPFGQWNAEQADAARQQKAEMLRAALAPQAGEA